MNEIKRALRPVKCRLRLLRLWKAAVLGALSGSAIALGIMLASFILPIRSKLALTGLALAGSLLAFSITALLRPMRASLAARIADKHGLKERV